MFKIVFYEGRKGQSRELEQLVLNVMDAGNRKCSLETFEEEGECLGSLEREQADLVLILISAEDASSKRIVQYLYEQDLSRRMIVLAEGESSVLEALEFYPFQVVLRREGEQALSQTLKEYLKRYYRNSMDLKIATKQGICWLDTREIYYLESWGHQITVHSDGEKSWHFRGTLKEYENLLEKCGFIRIHMSYVVNLQHCRIIERDNITLKDGRSLPLSRERKDTVRRLMEKFYGT